MTEWMIAWGHGWMYGCINGKGGFIYKQGRVTRSGHPTLFGDTN